MLELTPRGTAKLLVSKGTLVPVMMAAQPMVSASAAEPPPSALSSRLFRLADLPLARYEAQSKHNS